MHPVEAYLREVADIRRSGAGVAETSYYPALAALFNAVGDGLRPRVRCIVNLRNRGAGIPDGGLFTADQFQRGSEAEWSEGLTPARGVLEVKGTSENVEAVAASEQVDRYFGFYRQVLVTNLWDFLLVGRAFAGNKDNQERFSLAGSEAEFWARAAKPRKYAEELGERLNEYLKRVMLRPAPLADPQQLAWVLASYAREAKMRLESRDLPGLRMVREALEQALGLAFQGDKGEHFFRSTLVQTLFYGMFSAWVMWAKELNPGDRYSRFDWRSASWTLHVPMVGALFSEIATPMRLGPLGLVDVLDWTAAALDRVDRAEFFSRFEEEHAVQYFYEPFLEAFDPELRKDLGVWYTPPEIVAYMVERVDRALREDLSIPDGLADPRVHVLDPCCGTGAYLVEVLRRIARTLRERGGDALAAQDVKRAAMERVFGFEILPAPYVVAHMQLGILLQGLGAPLKYHPAERAGVFLTNALTGWDPPQGPKQALLFPELEEEREAAERVKREAPILVVLGNPPYNAFAGVSPEEERGLVEPYKEGLVKEWKIRKFNLDDLYVRFFRLAERRIAEMSGRGVVCFISNHSWVSEPSFVVMRRHLLRSFDRFWIENMHGNRKISEYAPDGRTSETVFAIAGFSPGIQQGVAVSLWVKKGDSAGPATVGFRDDINAAKAAERRAQLLATLEDPELNSRYVQAAPARENRFSFRPLSVNPGYKSWPRLVDLAAKYFAGLAEDRKKSLFGIERHQLEKRMQIYYDRDIDWDDLKKTGMNLTRDVPRYKARECREKVLSLEKYDKDRVLPYLMRPFDVQWCYYSPVRPLWREPRPDYWKYFKPGTPCLISRFKMSKRPEGPPVYYATAICDYHCMPPNSTAVPFKLKNGSQAPRQGGLPGIKADVQAAPCVMNASGKCLGYLHALFPAAAYDQARLLWWHVLSVAYSSRYPDENRDCLAADWPRIPLPALRADLEVSAGLGQRVAELLDPEAPVAGVTAGEMDPFLRCVAVLSSVDGRPLDPGAGRLDLVAGWGHAGKGGVTMPGRGRVAEREYAGDERAALEAAAAARGLEPVEVLDCLGETTMDVYLNDHAYWRNVPAGVWNYFIGGYQVIKKWLSYREKSLLGRGLTTDEARHVTATARRLAALRLLEPALDQNYLRVKADTYPWPRD